MTNKQRMYWLFVVNPFIAVLVKIRSTVLALIFFISALFIVLGFFIKFMLSMSEPIISLVFIGVGMGTLGGWSGLVLFSHRYREHVAKQGEASSSVLMVGMLWLTIFGIMGSMLCCGEAIFRIKELSRYVGDFELFFYQVVMPTILVITLFVFLFILGRFRKPERETGAEGLLRAEYQEKRKDKF